MALSVGSVRPPTPEGHCWLVGNEYFTICWGFARMKFLGPTIHEPRTNIDVGAPSYARRGQKKRRATRSQSFVKRCGRLQKYLGAKEMASKTLINIVLSLGSVTVF